MTSDDENDNISQAPSNVRGLYKRQHNSHVSHIERIRGGSPSYKSEEVMRLKNELAMQRLLRMQKNRAAIAAAAQGLKAPIILNDIMSP